MLGKVEILIVIIALLLTFYFVISWGAGRRKKFSYFQRNHKIFIWSSNFNNYNCHSFANFMVFNVKYEI